MSLQEISALEIIRAGQWRSALFTTYALSLGFFEGAVLPSLQRAGARDITIFSDVEGVAGALTDASRANGNGFCFSADIDVRLSVLFLQFEAHRDIIGKQMGLRK